MLAPNLKVLGFLVIFVCAFSIVGCYWERRTQVRLEGGLTPIFVFSGNGKLTEFSVYVVSPLDFSVGRTVASISLEDFFAKPAVWRIETPADLSHARAVENIGRLTYGVI